MSWQGRRQERTQTPHCKYPTTDDKLDQMGSNRRSKEEAYLEACRAPVHELDRSLRLDAGDGGLNILGHDITTVQKAAGHWKETRHVTPVC